MNRLFFTIVILALLAAACSATEPQDAASPTSTDSITTSSSSVETILEREPLDPEEATDVAVLFDGDADPAKLMDPGTWYAGRFSTPILFDLPVRGSMDTVGRGVLHIEVGDDPDDWDSAIDIIELAAYSGVEGPVPLAEIAPTEAWGGATELDSGVVESSNGPLTWVDVIYEMDNIDEARTKECPYEAVNPCVDAFVLEQRNSPVEIERRHRFVTVEIEGQRFVVTSVSPRFSDNEIYQQLPLDIAASLTRTAVREGANPETRDLRELAPTGTVPAATWVGELNGSTLTFTVEEDIDGIQFNGGVPRDVVFTSFDAAFILYVFETFVDGVDVRTPTIDAPLTNDEFFGGLEQVFDVTVKEEVTIGGLSAVRYELGDEHNPAFACPDEMRSQAELRSDQLCSVWAEAYFGPIGFANENWEHIHEYYVEEIGLYIYLPVDEDDPDGGFAQLFDSLELTPVQ